jgi:hypothetical protein
MMPVRGGTNMGLGAENGMTEPVVKIHKLGKAHTTG